MAASSVQNPAAVTESKTSKKKKAKAERTESPAPTHVATSEKDVSVSPADATGEELSEPAYLREIAKNIRNVNKKITNASKTDGLIFENKDKTLEELVALKIINADQKAQHLKKPALLAQLAQLEEQYAQLKKIDSDYRLRLVTDKAEVTKTLTQKFEKEKAGAVLAATETAAADAEKHLQDSLLTISQFLRLAAARRADDQNSQLDENLALEGVLLQVYSGDENGVATMLKLVQGVEETTKSVTSDPLQTTYAQVKAVAAAHAIPLYQAEPVEEVVAEETHEVQSDPTIAHASLTEIEAGEDASLAEVAQLTNGDASHSQAVEAPGHIANADVDDSAANAAGESQWDTSANQSKDLSMSQEWVEVPRDPAETETGLEATPEEGGNKQSWADEQPENPPEPVNTAPAVAQADPNDGFHQVQRHNRGRSERDNNWRGRGGGFRGGRGRGGDGRGRGRGRGGNGGGNGNFGYRGPRRTEEAS
ncbi:hypothetical protein CMQ_4150 [Grosmannia clavigera kw1407]|uniref:YAG7-like dimerisation domain-containing protein n=1 Tax=Grosmannia clavigera (strain kw1407 / UAMH 11150) TaxID=655863 RepID=F0XA86_GROCL|nr:uncharacterized protein CMQ_4150 [Grosmannia clavigera kw1407]EFX06081.1 hypothetical protein CMQ_4150 [Grosmannia clavigera kw1407]